MTVRGFIGGIFTLIGWGIALLSGACSVFLGFGMVLKTGLGGLAILLLFGGIPFAIGLFFIWLGKKIRGRPESERAGDIADVFGEAADSSAIGEDGYYRPGPNPLKALSQNRPQSKSEGPIRNPLRRE